MGIQDLPIIGMENVTMPLEVEAQQRRRDEMTRERQVWVSTKAALQGLTTTKSKIDINLLGLTPAPRHATSVILQAIVTGVAGERALYVFGYQTLDVARIDLNIPTGFTTATGQLEVPIFDQHYVLGAVFVTGAPTKEIYPVSYRMA